MDQPLAVMGDIRLRQLEAAVRLLRLSHSVSHDARNM